MDNPLRVKAVCARAINFVRLCTCRDLTDKTAQPLSKRVLEIAITPKNWVGEDALLV